MTIEESPEFLEALNKACGGQYREFIYGGAAVKAETKSQIKDLMKRIQHRKRETEKLKESLTLRASAVGLGMPNIPSLPNEITLESMEEYHNEIQDYSYKIRTEAERQRNPHFQEITRGLRNKSGSTGLICPVCGEGDHGNRMNGQPCCFMNAEHKGLEPIPLMTPEKAKDWQPPPKKFKRTELWELDDSEVVRGRKKRRK